MSNEKLTYHKNVILIPFVFVLIIWFVYWLEIKYNWNFNKYGIYPREFSGLKGILFSPFIHSGTSHLFNNSVPLAVLLMSLFFFYRKLALKILFFGGLLSGVLTWIIARDAYHIGASGIVYLLFSFLLFSGIIRKQYRLIALSMMIIFLYGSMIWYILPVKDGMSWEGHLSGFLVGLLFSYIYKSIGIVKEEYQFSKTAFDDFFDEEGNLKQEDDLIKNVDE